MFEQTDERLADWIANVVGPVDVSLAPPEDSQDGTGVSLYLFELIDKPPPRGIRRSPLQLALRYLITTWAEEPKEAHRMLGELVFAALDDAEMDVDLSPLPAETWQAFGIPPRPGFCLRVPVQRERPEPPTKLVREPMVLHVSPTTHLAGVLVTPDGVPLAGATIEYVSLQRTTRTDADGRFAFANILAASDPIQLRVKVKGREFIRAVEQPVSDQQPLVIEFDPLSERE